MIRDRGDKVPPQVGKGREVKEGCEQYKLWGYIEMELVGPALLWQAG